MQRKCEQVDVPKSGAMRNKMFSRVKKSLGYMYYRYNLETHLYMCEPWERTLVNSVLLLILSLVLLIGYMFVLPVVGSLKNSVLPLSQKWLRVAALRLQSDDL